MSLNNKYFVVIEDHDEYQFAISPPILGRYVQDWLDAIDKEQEKGRNICYSDVEESRLSAQVTHIKNLGFSEVEVSDLLNPPSDRTNDYVGNLPKYAQGANKSRIVHILCKSKCGTSRLAEVNLAFSSMEELRSAEMGVYEAKCLKCGGRALDNYNWYR